MRESRRALAAIAVGVGLFVAGCGGTENASRGTFPPKRLVPAAVSGDGALRATILRSVALTEAARTARTSISVTLTGRGGDALSAGAFDIAGNGVVDLRRGDADLTVSIPMIDRLSRGGAAIEHRIVRGVHYTKMPSAVLLALGVPAPVRWLSLDPSRAGGADASALSQSQVDPAGQLAFVAAVSDDARTIGAEPVRGVPATHYAATISLRNDADGGDGAAALRTRLAQLGSTIGGRGLTVDVWIDSAGRIRRAVVSVPLSSRSDSSALGRLGPDAMLRIQSDFYTFGMQVRVAAPPAAQVQPYSPLGLAAAHG